MELVARMLQQVKRRPIKEKLDVGDFSNVESW